MKTKIIEIIGPPGVGKSTIYQSLCNTWKPTSRWIYPDVLLAPRPGFFSPGKWLGYQVRMLLRKKLTKTVPVEYGLRFAAEQQELADFCWKYISYIQFYNRDDINKRFRAAYFLFATFGMYQAIMEKAPADPCIIQEGFLQKPFFMNDDQLGAQLTDSMLDQYVSLVPLPHAVIYMDMPDSSGIVKRLQGRNKIIASHLDKDNEALNRDIEKWQHAQHNMLEKLKRAGVLIVRINGEQPVSENVSSIKKLLNEIADTRAHRKANCTNESTLNLITQSY
jgi:thymidylate kinase